VNAARLAAVAAGIVVGLAPAGNVGADPPGPTDYETVVVGIDPATPSITVEMIGGDSFVQLTVQRGIEAVVLGYSDEPYLRFRTDGTVEENRLSPAVAQNKDRYGEASDATGDPNATPEWVVVSNNGTYAWHDHRAHWMSPDPPPGFERGQRIQDGVIPVVVDGVTVRISVTTTWQEAPSRVPLAAGAIVAGFVVMTVLSMRARLAWVLVAGSAAAGAIGWVQVKSVPESTGPSIIWWLLPAVAGVSAAVAVPLGRSVASYSLVLLGGIELALWVFMRRDGLTRALLPTDAPFWLDRAVTTGAAVAATAGIAAAVVGMFRLPAPD
jgi:hypothetical protein